GSTANNSVLRPNKFLQC
ncbi:unnamed protein product, partial [Oikopleura dioica]